MLIGELAKAARVSKDTIRHYDALGLLITSERQAGSRIYKEFSEQNISRIEQIRHGKDLGFRLAEMQSYILSYDAGELSDEEVVALLQSQLQRIRDKVASLKQTEQMVLKKLKQY